MVSAVNEGTVKTDLYSCHQGKNNQAIHSYETKPVETPAGNVSVAVGTDYKLDDGGKNNRTVFDIFLSKLITPIISLKGRVRTNYSSEKPSTQFRGGVQIGKQITDRTGLYAQVYAADKVNFKGRKSDVKAGAFIGADYKVSDKTKVYVEAQAYDLHHPDKNNVGVNVGLRWTF